MTEEPKNTSPSFGKRMLLATRAFLVALFRLLVIAGALGLVALGIFYGIQLYRQNAAIQSSVSINMRNRVVFMIFLPDQVLNPVGLKYLCH